MTYDSDDIRFRATFEDDLTPQLQRLEQRLKQMGATPSEIKMFLRAYDEATPKIKEARKQIDALPKEHMVNLKARTDEFDKSMMKVKQTAAEPIQLTFVDNLKETADRLFSFRSKVPLPVGGMMGSNLLYAGGAGALGAGGLAAISGVMQQSVSINSSMEQSLVVLNQTLKDSTQAQTEMRTLIQFAKKTPFNYQDVLGADVRLRQYGIAAMPGDPGFSPSAISPSGTRMKNQGWLHAAGEMGAGMGLGIQQAVEAIADAKQGYFQRMNTFGLHMDKTDFQSGGRFQGMTYEQGLAKAIERFNGSMEMQSKTFSGVMSNIHDIFQQSVLRPVGATAFQFLEKGANSLQNKMNSDQFQTKISSAMEVIQHKFVELFELVDKGKTYFADNLEKPLMAFGKEVAKIAATFGGTFGKVFIEVFTEVGRVISAVAQPLVKLISQHESLLRFYALMKALSILGLPGPQKGVHELAMSLTPLHASLLGVVRGLHDIASGTIKLGLLTIVSGFVNAATASHKLKAALADKGMAAEFKDVNAELSRMAYGLDQSTTKMKNLGAYAIQHLKGAANADVGVYQAKLAAGLQQNYGINAGLADKLMSDQGITSKQDATNAALALRDLKDAADTLGMSFGNTIRIMDQFAGSAKPIGLGGIKGAPYLAGLSSALHSVPLSKSQMNQGIYTGDDLMTSLMGAYHAPSADQMKKVANAGELSQLYTFNGTGLSKKNPRAEIGRAEIQGVIDTFRANDTGYAAQQKRINEMAAHHGVTDPLRLPNYNPPGLSATAPSLVGLGRHDKADADAARHLNDELQKNEDNIKALGGIIKHYQNGVTAATTDVNTWSQAQQQLGFVMEKWQHDNLQKIQRRIEDLSLAVQEYTLSALTPLERKMQSLQQHSAEMGNEMSNAQYAMSKFSDGLLTGEQAAQDQTYALEKYNKELQLLQLRFQTFGPDLGKNIYDGSRGAAVHVKALANFSLAFQQQKLARQQQMDSLQNDLTFGDQHHNLEKANRPLNQRTEMSYAERLAGVKRYRTEIDKLTISQHDQSNKEFDLQSKIYKVNQKIQDMNQNIQSWQNKLTDKQLHGGLRELQDLAYGFGRKTEFANQKLNTNNTLLSNAQQLLLQYRNAHDGFAKIWASMWKNPDREKAMKSLIEFGRITGILSSQGGKGPFGFAVGSQVNMAKQAADAVKESLGLSRKAGVGAITQTNWVDWTKKAIVGAFTGDLWRGLGDQLKKILPSPLGNIVGSTSMAALVTAAVLGLSAVTLLPALTHIVRQVLVRGSLASIVKIFGKEDQGKGIATAILKFTEGVKAIGVHFKLDQIPGVGKIFTGAPNKSLAEIAKGGAGYKFAEHMGGGKFFDGLEESFKFVNRFRRFFGGAAGALIGGMVGGPVGSVIGSAVGARFMGGRTTREDWKAIKEARQNARQAAKDAKKVAKDLETGAKDELKAAKIRLEESDRFGEHVKKFDGHVKTFGMNLSKNIKEFGAYIGELPSVKKARKAAQAVDEARGVPVHPNEGGHAAAAEMSESDAAKAARAAYKTDSKFRNAVNTAERKGAKYINYGGKVLKIAGVAAGALSLIPAAKDLAEGHVGKSIIEGADAGSYFVPYVGEARIAGDIFGAAVNKFSPDRDPNRLLRQRHNASGIMRTALHQTLGGPQLPFLPGGASNISDNEKFLLDENLAEQKRLATIATTHKLSKAQYEKYYATVQSLQDKFQKEFQVAQDKGDQTNLLNKIALLKKSTDAQLQYHTDTLSTSVQFFVDQNKATDKGLNAIFSTTDDWLQKIHHRINASQRALGLTSDSTGSSGGTGTGMHDSGVDNNAAQGAWTGSWIKGKGDSKGYIARVGEEGDELIVPLAPHRRSRAKSLLKQAHGLIGGMAHGGLSHEQKQADAAAMKIARKAWKYLGPEFHSKDMPAIGVNWSKKFGVDGLTVHPGAGGKSSIQLSGAIARELRDKVDAHGLNVLVHEMSHAFQSGDTTSDVGTMEGGATAFARMHTKALAKKLGWSKRNMIGATDIPLEYSDYYKAAMGKGAQWVNGGQFGFANGGVASGGAEKSAGLLSHLGRGNSLPVGSMSKLADGQYAFPSLVPYMKRLIQQYQLRVTAGWAPVGTHVGDSDHHWGGGFDLVPRAGWGDKHGAFLIRKLVSLVGRARGHNEKYPFRWVGWDGDPGHGFGNHLHLSFLQAFARSLKGGDFSGSGGSLAGMGGDLHLPHVPKGLLHKGPIGRMVHKALSRIRAQAAGIGGGGGDIHSHKFHGAGAGVARRAILQAMKLVGVGGPKWFNTLMRQASHESSFNPNSINTTDINAQMGDPSEGLLQVTKSNFKKYMMRGHSNILNPTDNAIASIRYIIDRYGHGNATAGLNFMVRNAGRAYKHGAHNIGDDQTAQLHRGEMVLTEPVARRVRQDLHKSDHAAGLKRKTEDAIDKIRDEIEKATKHLKDISDKTDKKNAQDHLSSLNDELRKKYGGLRAQSNKASGALRKATSDLGDKSSGEGTAAQVHHEQQILKLDISDALKKLHDSAAYKNAVKDVKKEKKTLKTWESKAKSVHSQGGKRVTKGEQAAIDIQKHVVKIAEGIVKVREAIAKTGARGKYLIDAAHRKVNEKIVEKSGIPKKMLDAKFHVGAGAFKKGAHSIRDLYTRAAKDRKGSPQEARDMKRLQSAIKQYSNAQVKKLDKLEKSYKSESKKAHSAAQKAGLEVKKAVHSHQKSAGASAKAAIHATKSAGSHTTKSVQALKSSHATIARAAAAKTAGHLKEVKDHVKDAGEKGRSATEKVRGEAKEGQHATKKSDDKRTKAEIEADRREKGFYKEALDHLRAIREKDISVNIHNEAHDNASLTSHVSKVTTRKR